MSDVDHLIAKKVADRYLKREVLGEGTYGVVYKAIDTKVFLHYSYHLMYLLYTTFEICKFRCCRS